MKNRITVRHGMLEDFKSYLEKSGWKLETPVGKYEVLRARMPGRSKPVLIHDRMRGCGYSIDERDIKIYAMWKRNRVKRGLNPDFEEGNKCTAKQS